MTAQIIKGNLVITIPANLNPVLSKTGKSLIVASANWAEGEAKVNGKPVLINLTACIMNK
jgi:hypothetical protein